MRFVLVILLFLAACTDRDAYVRKSPHTGVTVHASSAWVRVVDETTTLEARALRLSAAEDERFAVKTFVIRNDRSFSKVTSAWSFGDPVQYTRDDRTRTGLLRTEAGHIALRRRDFEAFAREGFSFELVGPRGSYVFKLPALLFAQVLASRPEE